MIGTRQTGNCVQTQVLPPPFDHLVILIFHATKCRRLLLGQAMSLSQFAEAFPEKFCGGKVVGHSHKFRVCKAREHRTIKYLAFACVSGSTLHP